MKTAGGPTLMVVARPNGAGKSTLAKALGIPVVDPDVEAAQQRSNIAGGREAIHRIRRMIGSNESFAFETTLAGRIGLSTMRVARGDGFTIVLHYVGIDSADDCLERIRRRVESGGHDVPAIDVRRRYFRSLENLPEAVRYSDQAFLFDNTDTGKPKFVASYNSGALLERAKSRPRWFCQLFEKRES